MFVFFKLKSEKPVYQSRFFLVLKIKYKKVIKKLDRLKKINIIPLYLKKAELNKRPLT